MARTPRSARPHRVAVVDDDDDARAACRELLGRAGREVELHASAREAVRAARAGTLAPVVLMDMHLPGEEPGPAIAAIRRSRPETLVLALTAHTADDFVFEALRAGAVGYVLKSEAAARLLDAIEIVERGGAPLSPQIARRIITTFEDREGGFEPLSGREREILRCFAEGASYEGAADTLGISVDTVRTHVRRLYGKLRVTSRSEALLAAVRRGILPPRSRG